MKKFNNLKMIYTIVPFIVFALTFTGNSKVNASENSNTTVNIYDNLIENEKVVAVMLPKNTEKLNITADELSNLLKKNYNYTVTSITKDDGEKIESNNKVSTGTKITINNEKYTALIYGDANGDGDICDADDLMEIINDYLGKKTATGIYRFSANLANKNNDNILDTDDLMQMINMYLGKLNGELVQELPQNEDNIVLKIEDSSNVLKGSGYSWIYEVYKDGKVKGEKWTSVSASDFQPTKEKEYTTNLTSEEIEFLKTIESKYTDKEEEDASFNKINLSKNENKEINPYKLNSENRKILKQILNKIFLKRDPIAFYKPEKTIKPSGMTLSDEYLFDLIEKKVVYKNETKTAENLRCFKNYEKELSDDEIQKIEELCLAIIASPEEYIITQYNVIAEGQIYYLTSLSGNVNYTILDENKVNTINSIVTDMDKLDGIETEIEEGISTTCVINIAGYNVDLGEKGYDFIESVDSYYLIISMGECTNSEYSLNADDIKIIDNKAYVSLIECYPAIDMIPQVITYPYCVIKFNKKLDNILIDNSEYKKINMKELEPVDAKPVIYLYPEQEAKINVTVGNPERLTCTYPKYENGWEVIAKPNGDLKDIKTGRNLYCLYWEGINTIRPKMDEGFVVNSEDTVKFLEEKLKILGLNEREANEFIIYWLPKLEANKYNFIRFQTEEEINTNMPLQITPKPDSVIRVIMEFKGLEEKINVKEQKLKTPERKGYTVVEWGGTEVK